MKKRLFDLLMECYDKINQSGKMQDKYAKFGNLSTQDMYVPMKLMEEGAFFRLTAEQIMKLINAADWL